MWGREEDWSDCPLRAMLGWVVCLAVTGEKHPFRNEDSLQAWLWQAQHHCVLPLAGKAWCETVLVSASFQKAKPRRCTLGGRFCLQSQQN